MARHFMHNGPVPDSDEAVMISRWQSTVRTVKAPRATLAALSWAADKAGMSYGRFLQTLGPSDEAAIQEQYEEFIAQREREMAKRREGRVSRNAGNDVDVFRNLSYYS